MKDELNARRRRFVKEYLIDLNATKAAERAGYQGKPEVLMVTGSRLLSNAKVAAAIADEQAKSFERIEVKADDVLREAMRLAYADIRDVVQWDEEGRSHFTPSDELSDDAARSIREFKRTRTIITSKDGQERETITEEVKQHPKEPMIKLLAEHLRLLPSGVANVTVNNDNRTLTIPEGTTLDDLKQLRDSLASNA
jgi:phage terminase small subunit